MTKSASTRRKAPVALERSVTPQPPTRLETPPTSVPLPPVETRHQSLPFGELAWENFERLCLRLVRTDAQVEHCQLYGTQGQGQQGIDLLARMSDGTAHRVYQCKREESFGPAKIRKAVETFLAGNWVSRAQAFVLCTQESLRPTDRYEEFERQREVLRERGIQFIQWDADALTEELRKHPDLIDDFFGRRWVEVFLGEEAAVRLGPRLDAAQTITLRKGLKEFYETVFAVQDPGPPTSHGGGTAAIPLADRFVAPDIEDVRVASEAGSPDHGVGEEGESPAEAMREPNMAAELRARRRRPQHVEREHYRREPVETWLAAGDRSVVLGSPGS